MVNFTLARASVQDANKRKLWLRQEVQWSEREEHLTQHSFCSSNPSESSPQDNVASIQQPQLTSTSEVPTVAIYPPKYRSSEMVTNHHAPTPILTSCLQNKSLITMCCASCSLEWSSSMTHSPVWFQTNKQKRFIDFSWSSLVFHLHLVPVKASELWSLNVWC